MNPAQPTFSPAPLAHARRGSVIMIVLVTILFATLALTLFIDKASNDLLVDARQADAARLRLEAYSALETTLGVLEDFRLVLGALHSPAEGWGDPLQFAGYEPGDGRTVEIAFVDESGKLSLPKAEASTLAEVFKSWGLTQSEAERFRDALLGWMQKSYVPGSASAPRAEDYDRGEIPITPPGRSLRSFQELAAIEYVRDVLYDENGEPNERWRRFVEAFSLYSYTTANINGGNPDALAALGVTDPVQQRQLRDFIRGTGTYQRKGPGYFRTEQDIGTVLGANSPANQLTTQISALRILVTVREGRSSYRLNVVVAPQGGATLPEAEPATTEPAGNEAGFGDENQLAAQGPKTDRNNSEAAKSLNYPFTILEIRENDEVVSAPDVATPAMTL